MTRARSNPEYGDSIDLSETFAPYRGFEPRVPVWCVTKPDRPTIHRFYDTSPISPSGRYLAATELPYEDRPPRTGDEAHVVVVSLETGEEVYRGATAAWDTQVGAHAQWGARDVLLFNRMDLVTWRPFSVAVRFPSATETSLSHPIYFVRPDGSRGYAPSLEKLPLVQPGYGVRIPSDLVRRNVGAPTDDGIFVVDISTGESSLMLSLASIVESSPASFDEVDLRRGGLYGFHVKHHPTLSKLMFIVRWVDHDRTAASTKNFLVTCDSDGSNVRVPIGPRRWMGGHHPNWHPLEARIVMNLDMSHVPQLVARPWEWLARRARRLGLANVPSVRRLRFVTFDDDGSHVEILADGVVGSGHPSIDRKGRYLITDSYPEEQVAFGDGTVPLRLLDLATNRETHIVRIRTRPEITGSRNELRVDPHPVWAEQRGWIAFNGAPDGIRKVFIADVSNVTMDDPTSQPAHG